MFYAPLAWYTGWLPTLNTSRWSGMDEQMPSTNLTPWTSMELIG
jgi:peptide/nickel transport system substrate-binding protein